MGRLGNSELPELSQSLVIILFVPQLIFEIPSGDRNVVNKTFMIAKRGVNCNYSLSVTQEKGIRIP